MWWLYLHSNLIKRCVELLCYISLFTYEWEMTHYNAYILDYIFYCGYVCRANSPVLETYSYSASTFIWYWFTSDLSMEERNGVASFFFKENVISLM